GAVVTEEAAGAWLGRQGLSIPRSAVVSSAAQAVTAAESLGYPVCAKLLCPDVPHRSDVGAVRLGLATADAVADAFAAVTGAVEGARIEGVLVAEQLPPGVELI